MLTAEQQSAVDMAIEAIGKWKPDDKLPTIFKIGGYAGTGKTTVAKYIVENLPDCMVCAFTGKAAYRLRQKGLASAQTIHRTIYDFDRVSRKFFLKEEVEGKWFLIDEGSMIAKKQWRDIMSFGLPVLLLGDPGQLEPIGADPQLMRKADVVLEQIHRQAEGNGIIQFATDIRKGALPFTSVNGNSSYSDVAIWLPPGKATIADLKWADIVLCAFNRTRIRINAKYRAVHGYKDRLCPGEQIIVLQNNQNLGVFNGQILTVEHIANKYPNHTVALCKTDDGVEVKLPLLNEQFGNKPIANFYDENMILADYGYCITCHKSQGSEWDKVVVIDEQCPTLWQAQRWRYTAVTRASKSLRYFAGKGM